MNNHISLKHHIILNLILIQGFNIYKNLIYSIKYDIYITCKTSLIKLLLPCLISSLRMVNASQEYSNREIKCSQQRAQKIH